MIMIYTSRVVIKSIRAMPNIFLEPIILTA